MSSSAGDVGSDREDFGVVRWVRCDIDDRDAFQSGRGLPGAPVLGSIERKSRLPRLGERWDGGHHDAVAGEGVAGGDDRAFLGHGFMTDPSPLRLRCLLPEQAEAGLHGEPAERMRMDVEPLEQRRGVCMGGGQQQCNED